jgi:type IV secretion system protein VirB11
MEARVQHSRAGTVSVDQEGRVSTVESLDITDSRAAEAFFGRCEPIAHLLSDPTITDISLNEPRERGEPGQVWVDIVGRGYTFSGVTLTAARGDLILRAFASGARAAGESSNRLVFNQQHPRLSCQKIGIGCRYRIEGAIPPATRHAPVFTIRKYVACNRRVADYVRDRQISPDVADALVNVLRSGESMIIAGATGCGKTTLTNALLLELGQDTTKRILTIEDEPELERPNDASVQLIVGPDLTYVDAVKSALRHNPNYIVLGEIRSKEQAVEAVTAWDSDHAGIATMHVGSVERIPKKLLRFCRSMGDSISEEEIVGLVHVFVRVTKVAGRWVFDCRRLVSWDADARRFVFESLGKVK